MNKKEYEKIMRERYEILQQLEGIDKPWPAPIPERQIDKTKLREIVHKLTYKDLTVDQLQIVRDAVHELYMRAIIHFHEWLDDAGVDIAIDVTEKMLVSWLIDDSDFLPPKYDIWYATDQIVKSIAQQLDVDTDTLAEMMIDIDDCTMTEIPDEDRVNRPSPNADDLINYLMSEVPRNLADYYGYKPQVVDGIIFVWQ